MDEAMNITNGQDAAEDWTPFQKGDSRCVSFGCIMRALRWPKFGIH